MLLSGKGKLYLIQSSNKSVRTATFLLIIALLTKIQSKDKGIQSKGILTEGGASFLCSLGWYCFFPYIVLFEAHTDFQLWPGMDY